MIIHWAGGKKKKSQWRFRGPQIPAGIFHLLTFQLTICLFWNSDLHITYTGSAPGDLHYVGVQHKDTATVSFPTSLSLTLYRIYVLSGIYFQGSSILLVWN